MKYTSTSVDETINIAKDFAKTLKAGDIVCMYGDLGAGKTAFTQGLAKGLEIKDYVNSPTFTIVNQYEGKLTLYHFDIYRIDNSDELFDIGFDEYIYGDGVCVIEWAQKIEDILPKHRYNVTITLASSAIDDDNMFLEPDRNIIIEKE